MEDMTTTQSEQEVLYFWAIGDLHFRDNEQWNAFHTPRMAALFEDMQAVWREEGQPAFCVSPGDIVDRGAGRNYERAKKELQKYLGAMPFYPGIGNHEYAPEDDATALPTAAAYSAAWDKPIRYAWTTGQDEQVVCIMLEQPDWFFPGTTDFNMDVTFTPEALAFLDTTLTEHADRIAIIFAHCPLKDTVLDRDPERQMDDDSQDRFFFVDNSPEVRAILARHPNARLYFSGHTHSGWGSPQLVFTERLGNHALTNINLMCPWYTGRFAGPSWSDDKTTLTYRTDDPDLLASFAVHVYPSKTVVRVRDHRTHSWIQEWVLPATE